jgi:hypothetical protein
MTVKRGVLLMLVVAVIAGGFVAWDQYRQLRGAYDDYRTRIQPGVQIAGIDVGWDTPQEARQKVETQVVAPYEREFVLHYAAEEIALSPVRDLGFQVPVQAMVDEAAGLSHQYDYWEGFRAWLQGQTYPLALQVPLTMAWDEEAARRYLEGVAETHDAAPRQPMIDVQARTFLPGRPGHSLDVAQAAEMVNDQVPDPSQREIVLPLEILEPDQSRARIEAMLSTLAPVMARDPLPPSFYTATVPISTTGGIEGTPTVDYSGPLTWTLPHFATYTGPLTQTTGFFFDLGEPGYTFNVTRAVTLVELSLRGGVTTPFTFEPDLVPPPPITRELLLPPLEERLAKFPGVTSILVKNLDTGQVIYESGIDHVMSGMSLVKIGIMVEVYRHYGGEVDADTHQEMLKMLGSESSNLSANLLMAAVGDGSATAGAGKVSSSMRRLGLSNFQLCAPFRLVQDESRQDGHARAGHLAGSQLVYVGNWTAYDWTAGHWWLQAAQTPRYDRCVRATPREMADLVEMIYDCTQGEGLLRESYPNVFRPEVCQEMIDIMAANDLRNMLGAGIPDEIKLAHKHGFSGYGVSWGDTRAEVGIVYAPGATWLVSFYIWQDTDWINWGINQPLYRDVSNMLYNFFSPEEQFMPLPEWAPSPEAPASDEQRTSRPAA